MQSLNIVFTGRDEVELQRDDVPGLAPGQVLVQTTKTLISSGTECIALGRLFDPGTFWDSWVTYPFHPGYSLVGRVVNVASDVTSVLMGERVALREPHHQYVAASVEDIHRIPDGVSDEEATWLGMAAIAQNGVRRAEHALGENIAIVGLGLLGQLVVQYARLLGAREIIAIDPAAPRLQMARAHGASTPLALTAEEAREDVLRLTNGGADVAYDVTGVAAVFPWALQLVRRFGRLLLLGDTGSPSAQRLTTDVLHRGLQIIGAHDGNPPPVASDYAPWSHAAMIDLFFRYVERGDMRVSDLITHRYAPDQAGEAYRMLGEDRSSAMGVIFDWTGL